ncbi:S-layer homology domain-containing protein [Paenibacillus sp. NPDC101420]
MGKISCRARKWAGIIKGKANLRFDPKGKVTRAEMAK